MSVHEEFPSVTAVCENSKNERSQVSLLKMSAQYVELRVRNRSPPFTHSDLTIRILLGNYKQVQPRAFSQLHLSLKTIPKAL